MKIKIHKFNRDRKEIGIKELDLTKFEKIAPTGHGLALKYKKGRIIELFGEYVFDDWYIKDQEMNRESAQSCSYSYIPIDKNKPADIKNRLRDEKGRPIKEYTKLKDLYVEYKVSTWNFIDDTEWEKYQEFIKDNPSVDYEHYESLNREFLNFE